MVVNVILDESGPWAFEVMLSLYLLVASVTEKTNANIISFPALKWGGGAFILSFRSKHSELWLCPLESLRSDSKSLRLTPGEPPEEASETKLPT